MALEVELQGQVGRQIPDADPEHLHSVVRIGRYDELYILSLVQTMHMLADEGSYYTASTVAGTGIPFAINATISETAGNFLNFKNNDSLSNVPNGKRTYIDYIKLIPTVAPASATAGHFFLKLDNVNRFTSGGTAYTATSPNGDSAGNSNALINAGALTTVAPSSFARQVGRGVLRTVIPVVNDVYIIKSGCVETNRNGASTATATSIGETVPVPPIILGPQQNLSLQLWFPGNITTAASFEFEIGWWER